MNPFKKNPTESREPSVLQSRWFGSLLSFCVLILIVAAFVEIYGRAEKYADKHIHEQFVPAVDGREKIPLLCELMNKPKWLDASILNQIFAETQTFAARDQATYDRLQNPQDQGVLREIAENYVGTDARGVNHWTLRDNAWIKNITEVRRVIAPDRKSQTIEIFAEYRHPAAWVLHHDKCYLIDDDMVRLPSYPRDYTLADRKATPGLMAITGVELPAGMSDAPEPSASWTTPDLAAAMTLANLLGRERFARQIEAIDMTNFQGRKEPNQVWITLNTIWPSTNDPAKPRTIQWGRPVGAESFYDVSAKAKIKSLNELYLLFNRIDANRDFVDIHTDQIWIPTAPIPAASGGGETPQG